jgi:hypothetical protein
MAKKRPAFSRWLNAGRFIYSKRPEILGRLAEILGRLAEICFQ